MNDKYFAARTMSSYTTSFEVEIFTNIVCLFQLAKYYFCASWDYVYRIDHGIINSLCSSFGLFKKMFYIYHKNKSAKTWEKKKSKRERFTSCSQFVLMVIIRRDNTCTTSAQIIPSQRPYSEKRTNWCYKNHTLSFPKCCSVKDENRRQGNHLPTNVQNESQHNSQWNSNQIVGTKIHICSDLLPSASSSIPWYQVRQFVI